MPVALATPSLHTLYHEPPRYLDALVLGISQSGESPDIVAVARGGPAPGLRDAGDHQRPAARRWRRRRRTRSTLHAGEERSVAATKTYTASLGVLAALVSAIAGDRARRSELQAMPEAMARQLALARRGRTSASRSPPSGSGWRSSAAAPTTAPRSRRRSSSRSSRASPPRRRPGRLPARPDRDGRRGLPGARDRAARPDRGGRARAARRRARARRRDGGDRQGPGEDELRLRLIAVPDWLSPLVAVIPAQLLAVGVAERLGRRRRPAVRACTRSRARHDGGLNARNPTRRPDEDLPSTARARSTTSASRSATASSWCSSARRAAASRR